MSKAHNFPRQLTSQELGRSGEAYIDYFVNSKLKWIFRPVHRESDFGIDGFIDIVDNNDVSGRSIAIQIKCGDSYLKHKTQFGFKYYGNNKHLNFYLNQNISVILIILNGDCSQGYWTLFDIQKTIKEKTNWWIEIPKKNVLNNSVKDIWRDFAGPVVDFTDQINELWNIDSIVDKIKFRIFSIPKEEIDNSSLEYIRNVITRLSKTQEQAIKNRGLLDIFFPEYDNDPRELFEIPEIRNWVKTSIENGIPWFYFLDTENIKSGLKTLLFSYCSFESKEKKGNGYLIVLKKDDLLSFIQQNFDNLNAFTSQYDIPVEINKERCDAIMKILLPESI